MLFKYVHFIELYLNKSIFKIHLEGSERNTQFMILSRLTLCPLGILTALVETCK